MRAVIGLGNPGARYVGTRHNVGFAVVDLLAERAGRAWKVSAKSGSEVTAVKLGGQQTLLAKPQTYMNRSGTAVLGLSRQFDCPPGEMLIVLDDFLLDFGRLRFRRGGSDGGHNGMASVLEEMGTQDIPRLRLGIGPPPPGMDLIDYVLSPFAPDEDVEGLIAHSGRAVVCCVEEGIEAAMNRFNGC